MYYTPWAHQCVQVGRHAEQADNLICNLVFHCVTMSVGLQKWFWRFSMRCCLRHLLSQRICLGVSKVEFWPAGYSLPLLMYTEIIWLSDHGMHLPSYERHCFAFQQSVLAPLGNDEMKVEHLSAVSMELQCNVSCAFLIYFHVSQLKIAPSLTEELE